MFQILNRILFVLALSSVFGQTFAQTSVKVSLDSAYVLMGKTTPLNIQVVTQADQDGRLIIPEDTIADKVEILNVLPADTTNIHNGRIQVDQQIVLQSFDSGTYILNPILYVVGKDTFASNRPVLKVIPVDVDSMTTINDYSDVVDVDRKLVDYLPDFLADYGAWIIALLILLALAYYTWKRLTKSHVPVREKKKPVPPYERALGELEQLKGEKLCEQGREREFYTRLTDILRQYLQGRFGINAMEMTSTQIRQILQETEQTRMSRPLMDTVLETADFVKFAKVRPLPDDNTRAFNSAEKFVEDTKPAPVIENEGSETTSTEAKDETGAKTKPEAPKQ
ncbi:MAG: cell wall anchor protein [Duncaniella sp.]|nr:cell wall anchor protein [Duncaniella sp.]